MWMKRDCSLKWRHCVVLLTLWPWPFNPKTASLPVCPKAIPYTLNTMGSFVFELCSRQTDRKTDGLERPTHADRHTKFWSSQAVIYTRHLRSLVYKAKLQQLRNVHNIPSQIRLSALRSDTTHVSTMLASQLQQHRYVPTKQSLQQQQFATVSHVKLRLQLLPQFSHGSAQ